ncbi:MAG TPA: SHOCT domain-containing protein [Gaiellales bacterium]|jgi:membrane protease YdiL (CAAX protease family)|nr:SHOCT domain-containing protein [Gaiellales bacterium]
MRGLVALGTLLLIVGALAVWVERVGLNSKTWSDTSAKALENDTVRQALSTYLVDQVYSNVDIAGQIRAVLPPRAQPLAAPAAAGLRDSAQRVIQEALARPRVLQAWRLANERANRQLVHLIEDDTGALRTSGGEVTLDLRPIVQQVTGRVGLADRVNGRLPPNAGRIVLLRSNQLSLAQKAVRGLRAVAALIVIVVILIFAAAIWVAPDRRRALRACALGLIAAGLVLIFFRRVLGDQLIDRVVADASVRPAAHEVWWIATDPLKLAVVSIVFVGLVGLVGAWIAGPGRRATATRRFLAPSLRDPWQAYGALTAVVVLLLAWSPTPATSNWVTMTILIASAILGLEVLRRMTEREFPDAERQPISFSARGRAPAVAVPEPEDTRLERLGRLGELRASGVLDDDEFAREKERVLTETRS